MRDQDRKLMQQEMQTLRHLTKAMVVREQQELEALGRRVKEKADKEQQEMQTLRQRIREMEDKERRHQGGGGEHMTTQPDALRLADLLDDSQPAVYRKNTTLAAAELRRLHAQRDALLAALKGLLYRFDPYAAPGYEQNVAAVEQAEAAINSVEDGK